MEVNETIDHLRAEAGKAWLETNSILYCHALDYQEKMAEFVSESSRAIKALHDHIWEVVMRIMEDAGKPMADGLGITLHLVDMVPTIQHQLTFHMATLGLASFAPEVYAALPKSRTDLLDFSYVPPLKSEQNVMSVLQKEVVKNVYGTTEEKAVPPTWLLSVVPMSSISVKAVKASGSDGPTSSPCVPGSPAAHTSQSPTPHAPQSPALCMSRSLVPHSSSKSPSLSHRSQSSRSGSSSSGSDSESGSASGSSSSGSLESGSNNEGDAGDDAGSQVGSRAPSKGSGSSSSDGSHSDLK